MAPRWHGIPNAMDLCCRRHTRFDSSTSRPLGEPHAHNFLSIGFRGVNGHLVRILPDSEAITIKACILGSLSRSPGVNQNTRCPSGDQEGRSPSFAIFRISFPPSLAMKISPLRAKTILSSWPRHGDVSAAMSIIAANTVVRRPLDAGHFIGYRLFVNMILSRIRSLIAVVWNACVRTSIVRLATCAHRHSVRVSVTAPFPSSTEHI